MNDFARNADDDRDLLRRFAEDGADAQRAFRQLVERYSGLVYGTAMRRLGDRDWAGDATQNVFAALATKAPALVSDQIPSVGAWLHRAATFESKRVQRDQVRKQQRQAMIRKELSTAGGVGESSTWNEIRPALDEALQKLAERERDILMLHYFDGMKFHDIAKRLGIGAEAAQKRGARALAKLSRLLRSRGAVASTAMLAAGLGGELAQAAPASLVTKLSTITKATTSTAALVTAMSVTSKTTIGTAIAALAILAASIGSGYLIGDSTRTRAADPDWAASPPQIVTPPVAAGAIGSGGEAPPENATAGNSPEQFVSRVESFVEERKQLMGEGQRRQKVGAAEQELDEIFEKLEQLINRTIRSADSLRLEDFDSVLGLLDGNSSDETKHIGRRFLLVAWGKRDPLAALEAAREHTPGSESIIFNGWGETDPDAALAKQQELAAEDRQLGREALSEIYRGWLSADAGAALAALQKLDFDDQKALFNVIGSLTKMPSARSRLLAAIPEIPDEKLRAELIREVGGSWAEYSPRRTFAWFDSIEFENPRLTVAAMNVIFSAATKRGNNMAVAADWIWPHLPPDQQGGFLSRSITGAWKRADPAGAEAWMAKHGIASEDE